MRKEISELKYVVAPSGFSDGTVFFNKHTYDNLNYSSFHSEDGVEIISTEEGVGKIESIMAENSRKAIKANRKGCDIFLNIVNLLRLYKEYVKFENGKWIHKGLDLELIKNEGNLFYTLVVPEDMMDWVFLNDRNDFWNFNRNLNVAKKVCLTDRDKRGNYGIVAQRAIEYYTYKYVFNKETKRVKLYYFYNIAKAVFDSVLFGYNAPYTLLPSWLYLNIERNHLVKSFVSRMKPAACDVLWATYLLALRKNNGKDTPLFISEKEFNENVVPNWINTQRSKYLTKENKETLELVLLEELSYELLEKPRLIPNMPAIGQSTLNDTTIIQEVSRPYKGKINIVERVVKVSGGYMVYFTGKAKKAKLKELPKPIFFNC